MLHFPISPVELSLATPSQAIALGSVLLVLTDSPTIGFALACKGDDKRNISAKRASINVDATQVKQHTVNHCSSHEKGYFA
jgi:hypothetical protein